MFGEVADLGRGAERVGKDVLAVQHDAAAVGLQIAYHHAHGGGFAGAIGPQKAHNLGLFHLEGYVVYRTDVSKTAAQVFYFNHLYS